MEALNNNNNNNNCKNILRISSHLFSDSNSEIIFVIPSGIPTVPIKTDKLFKLFNCDIIPTPNVPKINEVILTRIKPENRFENDARKICEIVFIVFLILLFLES